MAYIFSDGFDNYGNAYVFVNGYPWTSIASGGGAVSNTADPRFTTPSGLPGACVDITSNNYMRRNFGSNPVTVICGFGVKLSALPATSSEVVSFSDNGTMQCALWVDSTGALQFFEGSGTGTPIGTITAGNVLTPNVWYGLSITSTFSTASVGALAVYINGSATPIISLTGITNAASGNSYANQVAIGSSQNTPVATEYDDFYVWDTTGTTQNTRPSGEVRILTKMATAPGTYTNWTHNGLTTNWGNVAVQPPSTSDYNSNNTATTKDSYTVASAGLTTSPYFVVVRASLEKDDGASHTPSLFIRSGSVDSTGVATSALTSGYLFYDYVPTVDPSTNSFWTGTGADAAQPGVIEG